MNTWIQQMGFPLVTIIREDNTITATQKRFLASPREGANISYPKSPFDYKWYIPLHCYTDKDDSTESYMEVWMNMTDGNNYIQIYVYSELRLIYIERALLLKADRRRRKHVYGQSLACYCCI